MERDLNKNGITFVIFKVLDVKDYCQFLTLRMDTSGSVLYKHAKLTGMLYEHRVIFTVDGLITQSYIGA